MIQLMITGNTVGVFSGDYCANEVHPKRTEPMSVC